MGSNLEGEERNPQNGEQMTYCSVVVSTHLKNMSQIGSFCQVGVKIKNIWNHHPDYKTNMEVVVRYFYLKIYINAK